MVVDTFLWMGYCPKWQNLLRAKYSTNDFREVIIDGYQMRLSYCCGNKTYFVFFLWHKDFIWFDRQIYWDPFWWINHSGEYLCLRFYHYKKMLLSINVLQLGRRTVCSWKGSNQGLCVAHQQWTSKSERTNRTYKNGKLKSHTQFPNLTCLSKTDGNERMRLSQFVFVLKPCYNFWCIQVFWMLKN